MSHSDARHQQLIDLVAALLTEAKNQGANQAEAAVTEDAGLSVTVRLGEIETVERTQDQGLGVTVYFGQRKGSASSSDLSPQALRNTVRAACMIAQHTEEDIYAGLADASLMASAIPDLDLYHPWSLTPTEAMQISLQCEDAARQFDPRIHNSEGATLNSHSGLHVYGNSHGFIGGYRSSRHSLSCSVLAEDEQGMQRDDWWTSSRIPTELEAPEIVGQKAAQRTLARLGSRKLTTRTAPVVFQADMATSLLRHFIAAVRGSALYRRASFLLDHLEQPIFPAFVHIHENPLLLRGMGSAPFDNEGVAIHARDLVQNGILKSYVLDSYSARKLGLQTTGNAGGVRNLRIDSGAMNRDELRRTLNTGLWVTELMGQGVNAVTGDYSRGAAGFWIENGEIAYPVEEITIAGNLKEMFQNLRAVANDVDTRGSIHTGSWLIENMTIAGD